MFHPTKSFPHTWLFVLKYANLVSSNSNVCKILASGKLRKSGNQCVLKKSLTDVSESRFFLIVGLFVLRIHLLEGSLGLLIYYDTICVHALGVVVIVQMTATCQSVLIESLTTLIAWVKVHEGNAEKDVAVVTLCLTFHLCALTFFYLVTTLATQAPSIQHFQLRRLAPPGENICYQDCQLIYRYADRLTSIHSCFIKKYLPPMAPENYNEFICL